MNFLAKRFSKGIKKTLIPKNPNRVLLETATYLDLPISAIRRSLITINRISLSEIVEHHNKANPDKTVSISTLSRVLNGDDNNGNEIAKKLLADTLGLKVREIFPLNRRSND